MLIRVIPWFTSIYLCLPWFNLICLSLGIQSQLWQCTTVNFHFSTHVTNHSSHQNPTFHKWNGKLKDKTSKIVLGFWWDEIWNDCYHVFTKFPFWYRNKDESKKSWGVVGRGLGRILLGSIPTLLRSWMVIPTKSQQIKYWEV